MKRGALWLGAFALCGACYSMTLMQEPKPLPQGKVRGSAGFAVNTTSPGPSPQLAARVGLGAATEVRLKLSFPARTGPVGDVEAGFNVQPYDSKLFGLFLMPHYRYYVIEEDFDGHFDEDDPEHKRRIQAFAIPMLAVFHVGWYELFIGPDLHAGTRDRRGFLALGGHIGASVASGRFVHLTLEVGVLGSVAGVHTMRGQEGALTQSVLTVGNLMSEIGFSVSFGSQYRK
ncbi:MAG TPA: hypothetical protein VG963_18105 [Polyangiaceae bacterium]|nr:hypothetical protein [Polyangiaceae bacterium]